MCELLIFVYDHTNPDDPLQQVEPGSEQHAALPQPGDVISAQEDGFGWGSEEIGHDWFRLDKYPGVPLAHVEHFLSPLRAERRHDLAPTTREQYRAFGVDPRKPGDLTPIPRKRMPIGW